MFVLEDVFVLVELFPEEFLNFGGVFFSTRGMSLTAVVDEDDQVVMEVVLSEELCLRGVAPDMRWLFICS